MGHFLSRSYPSRVRRFTRPSLPTCIHETCACSNSTSYWSILLAQLQPASKTASRRTQCFLFCSDCFAMACQEFSLGIRLLSHWIRVSTCAETLRRIFVHWGLCLLRGCVSQTEMLGPYSEKAGDEGLRCKRGRCVPVLRGQTRLSGFPTLLFLPELLYATLLFHCITSSSIFSFGIVVAVFSAQRRCLCSIFISTPIPGIRSTRPHFSLPYCQRLQQCKQSFSNTRNHHRLLYHGSNLAIRRVRKHSNPRVRPQPS